MKGTFRSAYLLVNVATLLWAGNMVLGRGMREAIGPWTLACARAGVAAVPFALLLWRERPIRLSWGDGVLLLGMAATGVVGFQVLQYAGLRFTTALNAGLVNSLGPLLTLTLSRLFAKEILRRWQVVGAVVSVVGVVGVLSQGSWQTLRLLRFNPGDLLVLAAVCFWSLYSIMGRSILGRHSTVQVTAISTIVAFPLLLGPAMVECFARPPALQGGLAAAILYIGLGPSFLAFLAWNHGVQRLGASGAMAFYNTLPVYAGLLGAAALGEWPGAAQLLGGGLVLTGCLVAVRGGLPLPGERG
jgi:drug/metabolite transporter (DMT)-like permease